MKWVIFSFLFSFSTNLLADTCSDALAVFQQKGSAITSKRLVSYDDMKQFAEIFLELQASTEDEPCYKATLEASKSLRSELKDKRIETLNKYFSLKIYEEGGSDLVNEYAILTGKKTNQQYPFSEVVMFQTNKKTAAKVDNYDAIAEASRANKIKTNQNNKCTDRINQNEAVNIDNVRNQDGVGWCYAYAASDLLSYRLKKKISAVSLYDSGQSIKDDVESLDGNGGDISGAITDYLAKNNSLCLEEDLPSSDFSFCTSRNYAEFLRALYRAAGENNLSNNQCLEQNLKATFPSANMGMVISYVNQFGSKNLAEYLMGLQCKKKSFSGYKINPVNKFVGRYKAEDLVKDIDSLLDKGEIVGFALQYNLMSENDERTGGHATVIMGRRQNPETGDCEYLIRNSWGKDCTDPEGSGFTCHKKCDSNNNCRYTGNLWVSQRRIKNSMKGITYLP
jgi:hypothetical protein